MSREEYEMLPTSKPVPHVEIPLDVQPIPRAVVVRRWRCMVNLSCCLRLATGVWIMAVLDMVVGVLTLMPCIFLLVLRKEKRPLDHSLEGALKALWGNSTNTTAAIAHAVVEMNHSIDAAFRAIPLIALIACFIMYCGLIGLRAANGSTRDAFLYYVWKAVVLAGALFFCSLIPILISFILAFVARAHWLDLYLLPVTSHVLMQTAQSPLIPAADCVP